MYIYDPVVCSAACCAAFILPVSLISPFRKEQGMARA